MLKAGKCKAGGQVHGRDVAGGPYETHETHDGDGPHKDKSHNKRDETATAPGLPHGLARPRGGRHPPACGAHGKEVDKQVHHNDGHRHKHDDALHEHDVALLDRPEEQVAQTRQGKHALDGSRAAHKLRHLDARNRDGSRQRRTQHVRHRRAHARKALHLRRKHVFLLQCVHDGGPHRADEHAELAAGKHKGRQREAADTARRVLGEGDIAAHGEPSQAGGKKQHAHHGEPEPRHGACQLHERARHDVHDAPGPHGAGNAEHARHRKRNCGGIHGQQQRHGQRLDNDLPHGRAVCARGAPVAREHPAYPGDILLGKGAVEPHRLAELLQGLRRGVGAQHKGRRVAGHHMQRRKREQRHDKEHGQRRPAPSCQRLGHARPPYNPSTSQNRARGPGAHSAHTSPPHNARATAVRPAASRL